MLKNFLYFRPEYVNRFKCDGSKCNARCCKGWLIFIDDQTLEKYSQLESADIVEHIKYTTTFNRQCVTLDEQGNCPFLTEKNLCRIQLEHGEDFLSLVCKTYPRHTYDFGQFSEQSLLLTCPVAAEMILFEQEPMKFELVTVTEDDQSRLGVKPLIVPEKFFPHVVDIQVAMISILQERALTIDQRLIVLGFFLDRLAEISADFDETSLTKLIAAYESKKFLAEHVPLMLSIVRFNTKKFIALMLKIFEIFYTNTYQSDSQKALDAVIDVLQIKPDEKNFVSVKEVAATYERLADVRKKFSAQYASFLENYLVNELFINLYPWHLEDTIAKNFAVFVTTYKAFELMMFSATLKSFESRDDLLQLVDWFMGKIDHNGRILREIFDNLNQSDDILATMESLLNAC